jgi:hypothetical protein
MTVRWLGRQRLGRAWLLADPAAFRVEPFSGRRPAHRGSRRTAPRRHPHPCPGHRGVQPLPRRPVAARMPPPRPGSWRVTHVPLTVAHAGCGLMGLILAHSWCASASRWIVRRCPPRRREPGDPARASGPAPAPTPADPRPPRRTARRAPPRDPSLDQACQPTLVMSCRARARHT